VDPLVDETESPFVYAGDNPVSDTDPSGLDIFFQISASSARYAGEFLDGVQYSLQFLDSKLGPVGAAAVVALEYVNKLLGIENLGDPLIEAANEAESAVANSGRHQQSRGVVDVQLFTVSFFGFDTKIPTGGYSALGTSTKAKLTSSIVGCDTGGVYV
jgi:hypothetical protein